MNFHDLGLNPNLLKAVDALGFEQATPIQERVIATLLQKPVDLVGLAQTGTGKTAAYGLPLLQLVDFRRPEPQGIVICPTRELCLQITDDLTRYACFLAQARLVAVYGGASMGEQIRLLKKGAQIIIATPGRLLDLIRRKAVATGAIGVCVLDEADEMLSMGFQEELNEILKQTPETKRTWLFSATMPSEAARIAKAYMTDPVEITIGRRNESAANIDHTCYVIKEKDRYAALKRLIDYVPDIYGLIFCRTREETRTVAEKLMKDGYHAEALHGDLSQDQRNAIMRRFRERALQLLVATDVAARGLDVENISHVINYNLPDEPERYTHRSGRTARAGRSGASLILVNTREARRIPDLERRSGIRCAMGRIPQGRDICEKQLFAMVDKMVRVQVNHQEIERYLPPVYQALKEISKEELIQRFVSAEFNRFLDYYRHSDDLNAHPAAVGRPAVKFKRPPAKEMRRFSINVGRNDNIREGAIVRLVCDKAGIRSDRIGQIHLKREFSLFDVDKTVAARVFKALKGAQLDNRTIDIRFADDIKPAGKTSGPKKKNSRS
jgi:ATP-dependent RNA helicase DeaD